MGLIDVLHFGLDIRPDNVYHLQNETTLMTICFTKSKMNMNRALLFYRRNSSQSLMRWLGFDGTYFSSFYRVEFHQPIGCHLRFVQFPFFHEHLKHMFGFGIWFPGKLDTHLLESCEHNLDQLLLFLSDGIVDSGRVSLPSSTSELIRWPTSCFIAIRIGSYRQRCVQTVVSDVGAAATRSYTGVWPGGSRLRVGTLVHTFTGVRAGRVSRTLGLRGHVVIIALTVLCNGIYQS